MNLTTLRDELSRRADSVETPDLLPGVQRRIRTTKRRRVAGSITAVAAVVALGIAVAPALTSSAPDPADNAPADYVKDSVTISGVVGKDRLDKAWIGNVGETRGSFSWTPTAQDVAVYAYCAAPGETRYVVQVGGFSAASGPCNVARSTPDDAGRILPDDALWLDVPLNQATTVNVQLVDNDGRLIESSSAQVGIGMYRAGQRDPLPGATGQTPAPGPGDREENGLRFRGTVGGDTLLAGVAGKPGTGTVTATYTATGRPVMLHYFCTANSLDPQQPYEMRVYVNGVERSSGCVSLSVDLAQGFGTVLSDVGAPGDEVRVTAVLTDKSNSAVTVPRARLGLSVYEKGPQRVYDDVALDERTEYLGTPYQLTDIRAVDAATARTTSLRTPEGSPFLVAYGSSDLGGKGVVTGTLDGLSGQGMLSTELGGTAKPGWGMATDGHRAGPSTTVTLKVTTGTPTKGKLILAIYTPVK
ncbi:hypothetical protein [Kribbella sp. DT2]|uniref:hypothetical protein n=1 Tax=Kribbella sp. DT2 TaxID=3393427 RepID=UPI003CF89D9E